MARAHRVRSGECISSVALAYGFFPDTIWDHPENAALREERADPNVLADGDEVFIPDRRPRVVTCATDQTHRFKRRGVPEYFRLQLARYGQPRAGEPFQLEVDGVLHEGRTDADGKIEVRIPPNARRAVLIIGEDRYELALGHVDPITHEAGVRQRLENLGYLASKTASAHELAVALHRFQIDQELEPTGELTDETRDKLRAAHGC